MIIEADLKFFKSAVVSDEVNNGGRMSTNQIISGVKNNLFARVTNTQRVSGMTRYRKEYLKNENSEGLTLEETLAWINRDTPAEDYILIRAGTNTDTQSDATAYTTWKGAGVLDENVTAGVTVEFDAVFPAPTGVYNGDTIHVSDGTNDEFLVLDSTSGVSWAGSTATLSLAAGESFSVNYAQTVTLVSSCISLVDVVASSNNWAETNTHGGTYDESTYPVLVYNAGTVEDSITVTFTGAGTFSCAGTNVGSLGTGTTGGDFQPANGASYYFKLRAAGWAGTWSPGDTVTFDIHHSASPLWIKEVVPPGCASYSNNNPSIGVYGESA